MLTATRHLGQRSPDWPQLRVVGVGDGSPPGRQTWWDAALLEFARVQRITSTDLYVRRVVAFAGRFLRWLCAADARSITAAALTRYLAHLLADGLAPQTVRNHAAAISTFCAYLRSLGWLACDPTACLPLPALAERPPRFLTDDEIAQALDIATRHGVDVEIRLALATGLRANELRTLPWRDVDEPNTVLLVRHGKGGRCRQVPLSAEALAALADQRRRLQGRGRLPHVFPAGRQGGGIRHNWTEAAPRGLDWWHRVCLRPLQEAMPVFREGGGGVTSGWHLFRHTFATRLVRAGVPLEDVSRWLGHRSVTTTQMYAHYAPGYDRRIELALPRSAPMPAAFAGDGI